jgi:hypothetical protein
VTSKIAKVIGGIIGAAVVAFVFVVLALLAVKFVMFLWRWVV